MSDKDIEVKLENGNLIVGGVNHPNQHWSGVELTPDCLLLRSNGGSSNQAVPVNASASANQHPQVVVSNSGIFMELLLGLHTQEWSGVVLVDMEYGSKKVYFQNGRIVFASSNIMDDRLGEVIYREAMITLDELTNSAVQVTKSRKFGQILLSNGIFNNGDLWVALKLQVTQILRSIFMSQRVVVELIEDGATAPTEVHFDEGTARVIKKSYHFGLMFRDFLSRLHADSKVELLRSMDDLSRRYPPGTFSGDLLELIDQQKTLASLLAASKLNDSYTIAAVASLVFQGVCRVSETLEYERKATTQLAPLKAKLDVYAYTLHYVRKLFDEKKIEFPITDLSSFAVSLNDGGFYTIYVEDDGSISRDSINSMFFQAESDKTRLNYFTDKINALILFLIQVSGDNIDMQSAKDLRKHITAIS